MIDIGSIKASHPIESTIESLTGEEITRHKIRCPFHEETTPSLHVYDDGGWKCFGCGLHGDVIDFLGYFYYGTQYNPDAHFIDIIDRIGALDIKPLPTRTTRPQPAKARPKQALPVNLDNIMRWHDEMPLKRREYWRSRGLNDQTIDEFFLGWDGRRYTIPALYRLQPFGIKRRITPEQWKDDVRRYSNAIEKLREIHPDKTEIELTKLHSAAIRELRDLHPYWTNEQINNELPSMPVKYLQTKGSRVGIFNADVLWTATKVVICEGEIDSMLLHQSGYHAVSSTGGAGTWKPEWAKLFTHVREVVILYDNDEAGSEGANKVRASMRRSKVATLPDGIKDIGELWATGGAEGWLRENI